MPGVEAPTGLQYNDIVVLSNLAICQAVGTSSTRQRSALKEVYRYTKPHRRGHTNTCHRVA